MTRTEAPFTHDFLLDRKAVHEVEDHLIVEGVAADFGFDRQDEAFEPKAFDEGMKAFMKSNPVVLYHHHYDQALGKVLEWEHRGTEIWAKARIEKPEPGTTLADVYNKIKSGVIRGFSIGGVFHRREGPDGKPRIHTAEVAELSVTPMPINPRTLLDVAGKAFGEDPDLEAAESAVERLSTLFDSIDQAIE